MDLSNQEIRFNILISNIQQILSQTNEITGNISKLSQQKSTKTVMQQIGEDTSKATQNSKEYNRVLEEELKIRRQLQQNIDNAKSKQNLDANKRYWSDEEASLKRRSDLIRSQMEAQQKQTNEYNRYLQQEAKAVDYANRQEAIQQSYQQSYYERAKAAKEAATYESKLSQLRQQGMKAYMSGDTSGFAVKKSEFDALNAKMVEFNKQWGIYNRGFFSMSQSLDYFFAKLRSHISWIASGMAIAMPVMAIDKIMDYATEMDSLTGKIRQNLELGERYHNNNKLLEQDLQHLQDAAGLFAMGYGAKLTEVAEAQQIISRRFKDTDTINFVTNMAMQISRLDNVPLKLAAENIESVILQFKLGTEEAQAFSNQMAVAAHTGRITGQELLQGLQRSGSAFKALNMGTAESISLLTTLTTVTARSGAEVGNSLKSILTNFDFPKMTKALKELDISIYDEANKMRPGIELFEEMFQKLAVADEKAQNAFAIIAGGGKFQANMSKALLQSASTMRELYEKIKQGNDALTAELLMTGLDTYRARLDQLNASLQVLGTTVGNSAIPALKDFTLGLTQGIRYINEHKEELGNLISTLGKLLEAWMLQYVYMQLVHGRLLKLIESFNGINLAGTSFTGVLGKMGNGLLGFVATLGLAIGKLAIFYAIAQGVSALIGYKYDEDNIASALKKEREGNRSINDVGPVEQAWLAREEARRKSNQTLAGTGGRGLGENKEYEAANPTLKKAIMKLTLIDGIRQAQTTFDKTRVNLGATERETGPNSYDFSPGKDKNGAGSRNPYRIQQMLQQREVNDLFTAAKLSTDRYQESLDNLSLKEKLYGDTVENSLSNLALKAQREAELRKEQEKYNSLAKEYSAMAQEIISKDAELTEAVKTYKISLVDLSKEEWRELVGDNSYLSTLLRNIQRLTEAASEANKNASKIANEQTFAKQGRTGDFFYMNDRRVQGIQSGAKWEQSQLNQNSWMYYYDNLAIKIKSLKSVYDEYTIALERAEDELKLINKESDPGKYDDQLKKVEELKNKTADAYTAMKNAANEAAQSTKQFWADTVGDIIVQGNTLGDVMSNIWKRIATEAINQMFRIQRQGASILGTMGGKGKGKGGGINFGASASMYATSIPLIAHNGGVIASYPKMHSGGIVPYLKNDEVVRTLQSGEEVNSRQDRRTNEMLIELMKTMAQNQSNNVIQISAIDSKSFVEYADAHGDALVNLLRKQKSMGNAI